MSIGGLHDLLGVIEEAREMNEQITVLGAVCTMLDIRTAIAGQAFRWLTETLPGKTFETIIRRLCKLIFFVFNSLTKSRFQGYERQKL